jgi:hypothetical protein
MGPGADGTDIVKAHLPRGPRRNYFRCLSGVTAIYLPHFCLTDRVRVAAALLASRVARGRLAARLLPARSRNEWAGLTEPLGA